ncbi:TPA: Eco57I restriction-modification methylase domain-containing protein [Cronobacter sakazakii]|nr:Eco57I restriction-modification methylase domain-containing protein [Cronobacter sakazakii]
MIEKLEAERLSIQSALDKKKTSTERNRLGQYATPSKLARDILTYAKGLLPDNSPISFLDPALGSGAFYSALKRVFACDEDLIKYAAAFEIDPHYGKPAQSLWESQGLNLTLGDFTKSEPNPCFNLVICNPPYVRHHHLSIDDKVRLQKQSFEASGCKLSGFAGLYAHFLLHAHAWMAPGAIAGWLIPSEFMDVNYGREVKRYLLEKVTLLKIHRFSPDDVQFSDALVSSAVVWFKNELPSKDNQTIFTFGGNLLAPQVEKSLSRKDLEEEGKWTRFPTNDIRDKSVTGTQQLGDLFFVKRGLATGDNKFFVLTDDQVKERNLPQEVLRLILPSPRYVEDDEILVDANGMPVNVSRMFLLDPKMDENEIRDNYPTVAAYLDEGKAAGVDSGYLCRSRKRWYDQEQRPPAPIVCTYMGRSDGKSGKPFRFIRNRSQATVANSYLALYPKPALLELLNQEPKLIDSIWQQLNNIPPEILLGEGRVYGGGLHKLEPKELSKVPLKLS